MTIQPVQNVPLTVYQGATFAQQFILTNPDNATPIDLTGLKAHMQARLSLGSEPFLDLTTENGGIILGGITGHLTLAMTAAQTAALAEIYGIWDLKLINENVTPVAVDRLLQGRVTVSPQVTV